MSFCSHQNNGDMMTKIYKLLNKKYPQNYILKNPVIGTLIYLALCFGFIVIYEPLKSHATLIFTYAETMFIYSFAASVAAFTVIKVLKSIKYFSDEKWTFLKEIISIVLMLLGMSIVIYFMGFIMEDSGDRWNLASFLDSCKNVFLICIIPFAVFSLLNYRHLLVTETMQDFDSVNYSASTPERVELIQISSRLKKEELSFYPDQFIYAESDGNYVVFYLNKENCIRKEVIRNSISEIERQLSKIPFIIRTHRAFIVNVNKVCSKKGSTLGYRLKLSDTESEIPVSRQNTSHFDQLLKLYKVSVHNKKLPPVTIPDSRS
jgi:hypothetical protein